MERCSSKPLLSYALGKNGRLENDPAERTSLSWPTARTSQDHSKLMWARDTDARKRRCIESTDLRRALSGKIQMDDCLKESAPQPVTVSPTNESSLHSRHLQNTAADAQAAVATTAQASPGPKKHVRNAIKRAQSRSDRLLKSPSLAELITKHGDPPLLTLRRSDSFDRDENSDERNQCPVPDCGRVVRDLKAHLLTH